MTEVKSQNEHVVGRRPSKDSPLSTINIYWMAKVLKISAWILAWLSL